MTIYLLKFKPMMSENKEINILNICDAICKIYFNLRQKVFTYKGKLLSFPEVEQVNIAVQKVCKLFVLLLSQLILNL